MTTSDSQPETGISSHADQRRSVHAMTTPKQPARRWTTECLTGDGQVAPVEVVALTSYVGLRIGDRPFVWFDRQLGDLLASDLLKAVTYALGGEVA